MAAIAVDSDSDRHVHVTARLTVADYSGNGPNGGAEVSLGWGDRLYAQLGEGEGSHRVRMDVGGDGYTAELNLTGDEAHACARICVELQRDTEVSAESCGELQPPFAFGPLPERPKRRDQALVLTWGPSARAAVVCADGATMRIDLTGECILPHVLEPANRGTATLLPNVLAGRGASPDTAVCTVYVAARQS